MKFKSYFFLLLSFFLGWTACKNTPEQVEKPKPVITDAIANQDSVLDETPRGTQVQTEDNRLTVDFDFLTISFDNLILNSDATEWAKTDIDTLHLTLSPGQYVEDVLMNIDSKFWKDITVEERVVAKVILNNRDQNYEVNDWKSYQSAWNPVTVLEDGTFKTLPLPEDVNKNFPKFSEKELYRHLQSNEEGAKWADLIKNPEYGKGEKHWAIGISEIHFRLNGTKPGGVKDQRYIFFKIPI